MTDNLDTVLRNSLDAVDRGRRWATFGVVALLVGTAIAVAALFGTAAARQGPTQGTAVLKLLFVGTATEMLFVACCTVVVMFHITRMTKALLRAIEVRPSAGERPADGPTPRQES
jgi:hypothetical protein